ncbi:hypothetical protein GN316_06465 [Xylophilus sp. Kf1]|nr:hypothetical protein [Xylophilus sp. Kf1]
MSESNETNLPLVITSAPGRIWLDIGFDPGEQGNVHFSNLNELTWSENNATGDGIEYVRADLAPSTVSESIQDRFHADTDYDWNDPAGDDVRKVWLAGRASAAPTTATDVSQYSKPDRAPSEDGFPYG